MATIGIDIGGSGIKGAPVDVGVGQLTAERVRLDTPQPATVDDVVAAVGEVLSAWADRSPIGVAFPGVIVDGVVRTAANLDSAWVGVDLRSLLAERFDRPALVVNDADAAGIAEMRHGAGRGVDGVVMMLTFGTGIGSALFLDGRLVPNTELGHLEWDGKDAEDRVAASVREAKDWSWHKWAHKMSEYVELVDRLFSPRLVIIGGGVANKPEEWLDAVDVGVEVVAAALANQAGIIGAATAAEDAGLS